ncbi:hypothetical protein LSM04_009107 [Trypanosoma melophagium]|uniref:uncharacterized protein n=1 Tax=Trypanosoma melophagium TaxID=715481 RepID=UPI00351AAF68|nr:hypothetical protein LSM04_009107 [Trypanosoma melophagium]
MFAMMLIRQNTSVVSMAAALAGCIAVLKYTQEQRRRRSNNNSNNNNNNNNNNNSTKNIGVEMTLRDVYSYRSSPLRSVGFLFSWFGWVVRSETTVVLRTANRQDALLYHTQLTALQAEQEQLQCGFTLEVEDVAGFHSVLVIETRIRKRDKQEQVVEEKSVSHGMCTREMESAFDASVTATAAALSSLYNKQESLVLCRIPLPDQRVYRDLPPVIPRLIAAHADNRRLFPTYAEELLYYLPYLEQYRSQQRKYQQQHTVASSMMGGTRISNTSTRRATTPTTTTNTTAITSTTLTSITNTTAGTSSTVLIMQDDGNGVDTSVTSSSSLRIKEDPCSITSLLGDLIDVNAIMFSTSLFVDFTDKTPTPTTTTTASLCGTGDTGTGVSMGEDQFIYDAIHEAFFHVVLRTPLAHPQVSATEKLRKYPFKVWHMSRRSRQAAAELYVIDVAAAKGDPLICQTRVVDEVVAQAVLVHHRGSLVEFVKALNARFALVYTPVNAILRECMKREEEQEQQEKEKEGGIFDHPHLNNNNINNDHCQHRPKEYGRDGVDVEDSEGVSGIHTMGVGKISEDNKYHDTERNEIHGVKENETEQELQEKVEEVLNGSDESTIAMRAILEELTHLREFILKHRITFYNATLTAAGSNQLEEVFGVPATVFPFLPCARESVAFVTCVFDCISATYGLLNFHNFTKYAHDVFVRDRPEIVRHAPRIFRTLNKTRTGVISFEELCCWMARKLSSGMLLRPDAHLIAIAMSLRLPLALLMDRRQQWSRMECALASLSDADVEGY